MPVEVIQGRRVFKDDQFYTSWIRRGGDSMIMRVEMIEAQSTPEIEFIVQTREEPGDAVSDVTATHVTGSGTTTLTISSEGVETGIYKATATAGSKAEVRVKVSAVQVGGNASDNGVVRILPFVFFDNAK